MKVLWLLPSEVKFEVKLSKNNLIIAKNVYYGQIRIYLIFAALSILRCQIEKQRLSESINGRFLIKSIVRQNNQGVELATVTKI
jgi:hypothetical protein